MKYLQILLLALASVIATESWAQAKITTKIDLTAKEWTALTINEGLTVEYKIESCYPSIGFAQNKFLLRLTNNSDTEITVSWHALLEYDGECKTCAYPDEYGYSVTILPNSTIEGNCDLNYNAAVSYFSNFIDNRYTGKPVVLTGFEMFGLNITTTQK